MYVVASSRSNRPKLGLVYRRCESRLVKIALVRYGCAGEIGQLTQCCKMITLTSGWECFCDSPYETIAEDKKDNLMVVSWSCYTGERSYCTTLEGY